MSRTFKKDESKDIDPEIQSEIITHYAKKVKQYNHMHNQ